jgi:hypothetical protein
MINTAEKAPASMASGDQGQVWGESGHGGETSLHKPRHNRSVRVKTDCCDVKRPGFMEAHLVSHCGGST